MVANQILGHEIWKTLLAQVMVKLCLSSSGRYSSSSSSSGRYSSSSSGRYISSISGRYSSRLPLDAHRLEGVGKRAREFNSEASRVRTARFVFGEEGILAPPTREPHPSSPPDRPLRITHDGDLGRGHGSVAAAAWWGELRTHTDAPRAPDFEFRVRASQNGGMEYAFRLYPVAPPVSAPRRALRPRLAGPDADGKRSNGKIPAPMR